LHLELSPKQKELKKQVRDFLEKRVIPIVDIYEEDHKGVPRELIEEIIPFGYIGGLFPKEDGGQGMDLLTYLILIEELSRAWPSLRIIVSGTNLIATYLQKFGSEKQKKKFLPALLSGKMTGFFALSEPNVGSDAGSLEMTAELKDEGWLLNGVKSFVACGSNSELGLVFASTDKSKGSKGITAFLVEKGVTDYEVRPIKKMGTHSCSMAELTFANSRVPDENRLGELGKGFALAMSFLNIVRSAVPFVCAGIAQACIDASVRFAKERAQFKKPIGSFQLIQAKIADMVTLADAMRLMGYRAALMVEKGQSCRLEVSMAKLFASEAVIKIAENAMQIHGAYGYVQDFPIERYYRDIRYFTVADGTSEIQRLIIGREVLGISSFY